MLLPDPDLFKEENVPADTKALNEKLIGLAEAGPDMWRFSPVAIRQARREGKSIFPLEMEDPKAENFKISGPDGDLTLRAIQPDHKNPCGVFMHIHGGGWMLGAADLQDERLKHIANDTGLTCVSVDYRLAPEAPYPAACNDCESAAHWLATEGKTKFNTGFLAIGGDSAGGHLTANALLRLRDKHKLMPFSAAVFMAGAFDMGGTPSTKNFHTKLVLTTRDMQKFNEAFLQNNEDMKNPDVSPLYANLNGMPPAHFSIGTRDALLDDSIFMANKWVQSQADTELDIYPGGCHVFQYFPDLAQAQESRKRMSGFLNRLIGSNS